MKDRDPFKSSEWITFADKVRRDMIPQMEESSHVAVISPDGPDFDVAFAVQIGATVILDKPLVVLVPHGFKPPRRLLLIADKVIQVSEDDTDRTRAMRELRDYMLGRDRTSKPH